MARPGLRGTVAFHCVVNIKTPSNAVRAMCWASQESVYLLKYCESPTQDETGKNWHGWENLVVDGCASTSCQCSFRRFKRVNCLAVMLKCPVKT